MVTQWSGEPFQITARATVLQMLYSVLALNEVVPRSILACISVQPDTKTYFVCLAKRREYVQQ